MIQGEILRVLSQNNLAPKQYAQRRHFMRIANWLGGNDHCQYRQRSLHKMLANKEPAKIIVEREKLTQVSDDTTIEQIIRSIIADNPAEYERYRSGAKNLFGFLMGQVMKKTQGKANPGIANNLLRKALESE
jgi:aspartyl-tRNA(Asn)/glutamyl-tRNA(Gln) amidotransferase subunit B